MPPKKLVITLSTAVKTLEPSRDTNIRDNDL